MKNYLIIAIVAISSFLAGKYIFPPKPEIKEVVKFKEVEKEKVKVVTKFKEVTKPDGTKVVESTTTENTVTETVTDSESTKVSKQASRLTLGMLYIKDVQDFSRPAEFGATISVPVIGNLKAHAIVTTDKKAGLGVALEF